MYSYNRTNTKVEVDTLFLEFVSSEIALSFRASGV